MAIRHRDQHPSSPRANGGPSPPRLRTGATPGRFQIDGDALAQLPEAERTVLLLIAWADLTYGEAAVALEVPIGTVRHGTPQFRCWVSDQILQTRPLGRDAS